MFFPFYIDELHFCLNVLDKRAHFAQCHFIPVIKTVTRSRRILLDSPVLSFRLHKKIKTEKKWIWGGKKCVCFKKEQLVPRKLFFAIYLKLSLASSKVISFVVKHGSNSKKKREMVIIKRTIAKWISWPAIFLFAVRFRLDRSRFGSIFETFAMQSQLISIMFM